MNCRIILASLLMSLAPLDSSSRDIITLNHGSSDPAPTRIAANDPFGGDWPAGPGRELSGYFCGTCHSLAIVKQQGLSRTDWDELLDWMVEEQGMANLDPVSRDQILTYLSRHFGIMK